MKNPFTEGLPEGFNPDHYISFELHGGNGRWWVGYSYPDTRTSEPNRIVLAHRCAEKAPILMNDLPMENITGPGITFDRTIWCAECQDAGQLTAGRWEPKVVVAPVLSSVPDLP